ncbi:MAG: TolC family protein [Bacteroidales bacterium]|nr:TolC family protein [Bacteroidales bacterium]
MLPKIFLIAIISFGMVPIYAQETLVLSLDSAINYALDHNKKLINSKFAVDASVQKIKAAIAQGLPQASAVLDYTNYLGAEAQLKMNPAAPPVTIEFNPTSNFRASVNQLIFSGSYFVGLKLAKLANKVSEQNYQKDILDVKEQTIQSYYMILITQKLISILKENRANAQITFKKTNDLANAGVIEKTDVKKLSVMVASIDNALKSTERQLELGYNVLRLQLGLKPDQAIILSTDLSAIQKKYIQSAFLTNNFNIKNNPDYQLALLQNQMAEKQISLKKAGYLPTLVATYSYTKKIKKPHFDITPENMVGVTLSIPILSGGQRLAEVKQAKINYDIARNTEALLTDQLTMTEKQLRYNYNNLLEQFESQKMNVEVAKDVLTNMNRKYKQGLISSLELTSANNEYLTAQSNYYSAMIKLLNAELALLKINNNL